MAGRRRSLSVRTSAPGAPRGPKMPPSPPRRSEPGGMPSGVLFAWSLATWGWPRIHARTAPASRVSHRRDPVLERAAGSASPSRRARATRETPRRLDDREASSRLGLSSLPTPGLFGGFPSTCPAARAAGRGPNSHCPRPFHEVSHESLCAHSFLPRLLEVPLLPGLPLPRCGSFSTAGWGAAGSRRSRPPP